MGMLVEDARGDHMDEGRPHNCLIGSYESLFLFAHVMDVIALIICRVLCICTDML